VSKRSETESSRAVSGSPIESRGRARGAIGGDEFSQDAIWGAQISRVPPESSLDDATDEDLLRALQGERAPQAHRYFMILYRRHAIDLC